jgi:hypothetical protein
LITLGGAFLFPINEAGEKALQGFFACERALAQIVLYGWCLKV